MFRMCIQHNSCTAAEDLWCEQESLPKQLIFESMGCNTFEINDYLRTPKPAHWLPAVHTNVGSAPLSLGSLQMDDLDLQSEGSSQASKTFAVQLCSTSVLQHFPSVVPGHSLIFIDICEHKSCLFRIPPLLLFTQFILMC